MSWEKCEQGYSAEISFLKKLPESQAGSGRHRCAICAYSHGVNDGKIIKEYPESNIEFCKHGSMAPIEILENIHENQAGDGRHKCLVCAYEKGYSIGLKTLKSDIEKNIMELGNLTHVVNNFSKAIKKTQPSKTLERKYKPNYLLEQQYKSELGLMGELLVKKYEEALKNRVEHTSVSDDNAGYDIKIYLKDDTTKYIEVKTTTGKFETPFFMSKNEVDFMKKNNQNYFIYRVYDFNFIEKNGLFTILTPKDLEENFNFECQSFVYGAAND